MKHILKSLITGRKPVDTRAVVPDTTTENETQPNHIDTTDPDAVVKTVSIYSYFIYSAKSNKIIDNIYLTENQAYQLNDLMKSVSTYDNGKQDITFLRM